MRAAADPQRAFLEGLVGADDELAKVVDGPRKVFVHETCADQVAHLSLLLQERAT